jgi:1,4-dihydroxy-2-naphthoate octaprenyltransferase
VQGAATLAFALSVIPGAFLVAWGGWPILLLGSLSIAAGAAYTAGPYPTGYHGLGEVFVLAFFGFAAVAGSYYLQAFEVSGAALLGGAMIGMFSTAVLVANNLRDIDSDARVGKRTLAVRFGQEFAIREYAALMLVPFALAPVLGWLTPAGPVLALPLVLVLPRTIGLVREVRSGTHGTELNNVLARTNRLLLAAGILLCAGTLLPRW